MIFFFLIISSSCHLQLRSILTLGFNDHLQIGVFSCSYFMQGERSVPRASDIWRNKVKDFLAARYYLTHIGDITHISDICDIHDISVNYDVNLPTKK